MSETFEIIPFAMAHGGDALGRYEGRAIFVPYTMPGERVRVELIEDHKRYARARLVEILDPAPARVAPPCPYFGPSKCGGCQFQHIAYPTQVQVKGRVVIDQLERIGKFKDPPVLEPISDETGWEYRNRALFRTTDEGYPGFLSAGTQDVYPVGDCLIVHPLLSRLYRSLHMKQPDVEKMELRVGTATGDLMVVIQTYDEESPSLEVDFPLSIVQVRHDTTPTPLVGLDYITEVVRGREFRISATSFFQVNSNQAAQLVELVLEALALQGDEVVVDAFCGVGLFTAFIAEQASLVVGIELNPDAIDDAVYNLANAENVTLLEGLVEHALPEIEQPIDAVVLDPPRAGMERAALDALVHHAPERIVYVSCDLATFARDSRRLVEKGYTLAWVQPVDLFPQTYHIETVALLTR